jgi:hydrogenase-4 component B
MATWVLMTVGLVAFASATRIRWSRALILILSLGILLYGVSGLVHGGTTTAAAGTFPLSPLRAWFLLVLGLVSSMSAWYRWGYHDDSAASRAWSSLFLLSMMTVIVSNSVWVFMTAWEGMTITSFFLVTTHHEHPRVLQAGYIYLVMSQLSAMLILAGMLVMGTTLHSLNFSVWAIHAPALSPATKNLIFALLGLGFSIKSGVVPFHIWLPRAHPVAPTPVSSLMSGAMIKLGIFGIIQFLLIDLGPTAQFWPLLVLAAGALSALLGVLYALMEHDLKRLLAYHSVENIGIILLGVGTMGVGLDWHRPTLVALGLAAALFHTLNHAIFKSQLFFAAGAVQQHTGTLDAARLGGLVRTLPGIAWGFVAGSMAICGLPPFNGFVSEWLTFRGLLGLAFPHGGLLAVGGLGLAMVLGLTGALAGVCFVKATGVVFLGEPRIQVPHHAIPASMTWPVLGLGIIALILGVVPEPLLHVISQIYPGGVAQTSGMPLAVPAQAWIVALVLVAGTALMAIISRVGSLATVPRWACGRIPDASMQLTSTSFTQAIRTTFAVIYRPHRTLQSWGPHAPEFPERLVYQGGTQAVWERHLYQPLYQLIWRVSHLSARLQAGPVRLYLIYLLGTVGLMLALLH